MSISQIDMERWLNPWPIAFRNRRASWDLRIVPLKTAARRLTCIWDVAGDRKTIGWWADRAAKGRAPGEQHYIHSLARSMIPTTDSLTVAAVRNAGEWVVVDGNHRLIAACLVGLHGYKGITTRLSHVGLLVRRERGCAF